MVRFNVSARAWVRAAVAIIWSAPFVACFAQPNPMTVARPPPGRERVLTVPEAVDPPAIDGDLSDRAWRTVAVAEQFWISEQQRGPSEKTEVLITSDRTHLYFAFMVYDSDPKGIEALQSRRDGALGFDDQVTIQLDPFLTYREISSFSVNARGTQNDVIATGRARQRAWRGDWKAAVSRTEYGWAAEVAIPYEILNFHVGTSVIGVNFVRYHHRTAERSRWADITVRALPEEMGQINGLRPSVVGTKQEWTFLPYALVGRNIPDRDGDIRESLASAGVDIRYEPRPDMTGVISLLPDFSQVERAVTSVDFSYNEKFRGDLRPFFQEGAAYFRDASSSSATTRYFYSNRVPDFDYGAKAFGRTDGYQFGTLVTRAPDDRTDIVAQLQRQFGRTRNVSAMIVSTDRTDLRNQLYVLRGSGRESSGVSYAFDAAGTRTDLAAGDGSFAQGSLGYGQGFWTVGGTLDRYSKEFFPADGLLDDDLPDTSGGNGYVSYYHDRPEGFLREVRGDLTFQRRETGDGRLQRRKFYAGGYAELREQQVRLGGAYSEGPYRPVDDGVGGWEDTFNEDWLWTAYADFNTRSSWFGYGVSYSSGRQGGGDYRYVNGYVSVRPVSTLAISLASERLENFGTYDQTVLTGTWDVTPRHTLAGRYINAYYGDEYRLAYTWRARRNVDVFAVYDRLPGLAAQVSAKLLMTF